MKNLALFILLAIFVFSCRSGGNGGGAPGYTHNQLAETFVARLNLDYDFNVTLVKSSTLQEDYIVIYDPYTGTYDAIDIRYYNPSYDNAANYYYTYSSNHYFGLTRVDAHYEYSYETYISGYDYYGYPIYSQELITTWVPTRYHDYYTGVTFEKTNSTPKDLAKMAALKEVAEIEKKAKFLSSSQGLGLSLERAKEVARLMNTWRKSSLKSMTEKELNKYSTELLGFTVSGAKEAMNSSFSGDSTKLNELVNIAAEKNGITPEHATKLLNKAFNIQ